MTKTIGLLAVVAALTLTGCSQESRSPDAIRNDTANVTSAATRDAKAIALGVVDGLKRKGTVNINKGSREDLESLPGINSTRADVIISHRPYQTAGDLLRRHIVTKSEYNLIADKITAK